MYISFSDMRIGSKGALVGDFGFTPGLAQKSWLTEGNLAEIRPATSGVTPWSERSTYNGYSGTR